MPGGWAPGWAPGWALGSSQRGPPQARRRAHAPLFNLRAVFRFAARPRHHLVRRRDPGAGSVGCARSDLHVRRLRPPLGRMPPSASYLFVGEGRRDEQQGRRFSAAGPGSLRTCPAGAGPGGPAGLGASRGWAEGWAESSAEGCSSHSHKHTAARRSIRPITSL